VAHERVQETREPARATHPFRGDAIEACLHFVFLVHAFLRGGHEVIAAEEVTLVVEDPQLVVPRDERVDETFHEAARRRIR